MERKSYRYGGAFKRRLTITNTDSICLDDQSCVLGGKNLGPALGRDDDRLDAVLGIELRAGGSWPSATRAHSDRRAWSDEEG
jgi:hypothetical protein